MLDIRFTEEAFETLYAIENQIAERWGIKFSIDFENRVFEVLKTIQKTPFIFQIVDSQAQIRRGLVHRNCSFYYKVSDSRIDVLFFWDNRQEPIL